MCEIPDEPEAIPQELEAEAPDLVETENPVLARLIQEVRNEGAKGPTTYDRVHNRHNR